MQLLLLNQRVDLDDPGQGVAIDWMTAFARRVDRVFVISQAVGVVPVIENVEIHSVGGERRLSRARRVAEFYRHLVGIVRRHRVDGCFVHMVPISSVLAAPILKPLGVPMVQWYTHSVTPWEVRWAHRLVNRVVTASAESFRIPSQKVLVTGHGIPTARFARGAHTRTERGPFAVLAVGRVSPVKRYDLLLAAVAKLVARGADLQVWIVGGLRGRDDHTYQQQIKAQIAGSGLDRVVRLIGEVPRAEMPDWYRRADLLVHLCDSGLDKAVLEAMSCELPVITTGSGFRQILQDAEASELWVPPGDVAGLVSAIERQIGMAESERREVARALREVVVVGHDEENLVSKVLAEFAVLSGRLRTLRPAS